MAQRRFWKGFAAGTAVGTVAGVGSWLLTKTLGRQEYGSIMRLEKSLQVGRPIEEVFRAWSELQDLPRYMPTIQRISLQGKRSHWVVNAAGRVVEWDAKLTQNIPGQALGWKSVNGPKHTGRINFARLGNDTLVHVVMNYAPPAGAITSGVVEAFGRVEGVLEQALREFKAGVEKSGPQDVERQWKTGTYGGYSGAENPSLGMAPQASRFGGVMNAIEANEAQHKLETTGDEPPNPVDYTSPSKSRR